MLSCLNLRNNYIFCYIKNKEGYFEWNSTAWIRTEKKGIISSQYCPLGYCLSGEKTINLATNPDAQCAFNHAGILCGGCKIQYSLAIGSLRCIKCSNKYTSLLIFFLGADIMLAIFILSFNLTVTHDHGLVNGLILYANIVWTYKDLLFPPKQQPVISMLQIFVAWLNLDFGIETCFIVGLTAFWKTRLQFLFPLYI